MGGGDRPQDPYLALSGRVKAVTPSPSFSLDLTLAALADPHRRRTVELLRTAPQPSGALARALGLSPPAMSRHLRTLRHSGLVEERADGLDARVRIYSLRREPMNDLIAWLAQTEAMWVAQLGALKAHVEAPPSPKDDA